MIIPRICGWERVRPEMMMMGASIVGFFFHIFFSFSFSSKRCLQSIFPYPPHKCHMMTFGLYNKQMNNRNDWRFMCLWNLPMTLNYVWWGMGLWTVVMFVIHYEFWIDWNQVSTYSHLFNFVWTVCVWWMEWWSERQSIKRRMTHKEIEFELVNTKT